MGGKEREIWKFGGGFDRDFIVKEKIKDKDTHRVYSRTLKIKRKWVNFLLFWIKRWKILETHKCYDFALYLGYSDWKSLWKERKEYFERYYYPVKVLEAMGVIRYSGKGEITRIR